jgi:hypothetical protein
MSEEKEVKKGIMTTESLQKSQAEYKGKDIAELVEITLTEDSKYYKKGQVDQVHPATAALFKAKGLKFTEKKVDRDKQAKEIQKALVEFEKELVQ